jgi:hypothetical protein
MTPFGLQSKLITNLKTELEDQQLHLSPYCEQRGEHMIRVGVELMSIANVTEVAAKINLADENIKRLVEYLSDHAKTYGSYPEMEDIMFDSAIAECYPLWPYC